MGYSMEGSGGMGDKVTEARVDGMSHVGDFGRGIAHSLYCILWREWDRGLHGISCQ